VSVDYENTRPWLVFFRRRAPHWWFDYLIDPNYRHVSAAAYYPGTERWVFFEPSAAVTSLVVLAPGPHVDALMGQWAAQSSMILRFHSCRERKMAPPIGGCTAAIKALLGVRAGGALWPKALCKHLLAQGAEVIPVPAKSENHGISRFR
jgi:hypothetical protein